jgi:hypothetical protein
VSTGSSSVPDEIRREGSVASAGYTPECRAWWLMFHAGAWSSSSWMSSHACSSHRVTVEVRLSMHLARPRSQGAGRVAGSSSSHRRLKQRLPRSARVRAERLRRPWQKFRAEARSRACHSVVGVFYDWRTALSRRSGDVAVISVQDYQMIWRLPTTHYNVIRPKARDLPALKRHVPPHAT